MITSQGDDNRTGCDSYLKDNDSDRSGSTSAFEIFYIFLSKKKSKEVKSNAETKGRVETKK